MPFVGLVHSRGWEPPDDPAPEPSRPRVPWRPLTWIAAWWAVLALVPVADRVLGPVVGYAVLLSVVAVGLWRVERWCGRQYWRGLRDYQA